jgi:hypothetical protein
MTFVPIRLLSVAVAIVTLTGCQSASVGFPSANSWGSAVAPGNERAEGVELNAGAVLFVATGDNVYLLSYPRGKLIGKLGVMGYSLCSDQSGDVFVPTTGYEILEYSHAGKLINTLQDGDVPLGCSVDPTTGNLAVTNEASGAGEVAIFPKARGTAQWYTDSTISTFGLCGYDNQGNLFVDGSGSGTTLAELPKGSATFKNFSLGSEFDPYGNIQWDGRHITLTNPKTQVIYRLAIGRTLKIVGSTHVHSWHNSYSGHWPYVQTWVQDGQFIAQSSADAELGLWRYPEGGSPYKTLGPFERGTASIWGVVVSQAQARRSLERDWEFRDDVREYP